MFSKITKLVLLMIVILIILFVSISIYNYLTMPSFIKNYSKAEALIDYDYAWETIENYYPYLNTVKRIHGVDPMEIKNIYRNEIEKYSMLGFSMFYEILQESIAQLGGLGHLTVMNPQYYSYITSTFRQHRDTHEFWYDLMDNPTSIDTYDYLSKKQISFSGSFKPFFNRSNVKFDTYSTDTMMITVQYFNYDLLEQDLKRIERFIDKNKDRDNLILNLTECHGGNDYYWIEALAYPFMDQPLTANDRYVLMKSGDIMDDFFNKYPTYFDSTVPMADIKSLPNVVEEDLEELDLAFVSKGFTLEPTREPIFDGNIYVLVNQNVQSSSDEFASFCKDTGLATLVGTPTGGNGPSINPFYFSLPESGLYIVFQVDYTMDITGRCNSEFGIEPDILSLPSERPLDTCLRIIKEQ